VTTFALVLFLLLIPLCLALVGLILLQGGAGDISSAFGGGGQLDSTLGVGAGRKMSKITGWMAGTFFVIVLLLSIQHAGDFGKAAGVAPTKLSTDPAVPPFLAPHTSAPPAAQTPPPGIAAPAIQPAAPSAPALITEPVPAPAAPTPPVPVAPAPVPAAPVPAVPQPEAAAPVAPTPAVVQPAVPAQPQAPAQPPSGVKLDDAKPKQ
jgi:protein translocase SecG subunit